MIFAPIVQIANECHCFICTRSKLSEHNTCAICKLIFDLTNCTIYDCVTNRWDLTSFSQQVQTHYHKMQMHKVSALCTFTTKLHEYQHITQCRQR